MIELDRVARHNLRATRNDKPGTLSLEEWTATLKYFQWKCAYCGGPYQVLEHVAPVELSGTTRTNCVPACTRCNRVKNNKPVWWVDWPEYSKGLFNDWLNWSLGNRDIDGLPCNDDAIEYPEDA